ncbi:radical SAM protein [Treponema primitia]|uniref:radical SAM protein n=1 Tax=Treponema primitia TaxID=88058 RepID=UPI0039803125
MSTLKDKLYDELYLKLALNVEGVQYDVGTFDKLLRSNITLKKREYCTRDKELITTKSYNIPYDLQLPNGFRVNLITDRKSPYKIVEQDGVFSITYFGKWVCNITFPQPPAFFSGVTSDGTSMREIAADGTGCADDKGIAVMYSSECSVKDKGETCLFCTFNGVLGLENSEERPPWRNPLQIAETVKAAYEEGFTRINISGGFIPERREVDYYLDVAEAIQDQLGRKDFNGAACIGAPQDLAVIDKYKEVGYNNMSFNMEVWGEDYFNIFCPGKVSECGGFNNWVKAIEYAVSVFGKGNIRSNFVSGLQQKEKLLEGLEYLISIGVVTNPSPWVPAIGSPLEGHRSPTVDWHWDVQVKNAELLKKYGRTSRDIFNTAGARNYAYEIYQIENETLPIFKEQKAAV